MLNNLMTPTEIVRSALTKTKERLGWLVKMGVGEKICPLWCDEIVRVATLGDDILDRRKYCKVFGRDWQTMAWPRECPFEYMKCTVFRGYLYGHEEARKRNANPS